MYDSNFSPHFKEYYYYSTTVRTFNIHVHVSNAKLTLIILRPKTSKMKNQNELASLFELCWLCNYIYIFIFWALLVKILIPSMNMIGHDHNHVKLACDNIDNGIDLQHNGGLGMSWPRFRFIKISLVYLYMSFFLN